MKLTLSDIVVTGIVGLVFAYYESKRTSEIEKLNNKLYSINEFLHCISNDTLELKVHARHNFEDFIVIRNNVEKIEKMLEEEPEE